MSEREVMEYDVVVVGAGPAGLSCAIRLKQLSPETSVCVIEKASEIGAQILSGAVIEPEPLDALIEGWRDDPPPICVPAGRDEFLLLSKTGKRKLPTPPQQKNHGNFIVSLGAMCAWLAPKAEALGVDLFPGFAAADLSYAEDGSVQGVIIGDLGVDRQGQEKDSYVQGIEIRAQMTVLGEGCRGHLTKRAIQRFKLDADCDPQTYGIGMKELWQLPPGRVEPGLIQHSVGWPLPNEIYGGSFVYHLDKDRVAIGFVCALDYKDPNFMPFEAFQQFKHHPHMRELLDGGEILSAGARAISEGGFQSLPRVEMPGAILIGDSAGLLNVPKIKGTHQAMKSGMLAAEHLAEGLSSEGFDARLRDSEIVAELKAVRNIRPGFNKGLWRGMATAAIETVTGGKLPRTLPNHADHAQFRRLEQGGFDYDWVDRELPPRDRLASVYFAATAHDEDQPIHLKIVEPDVCFSRCEEEYGNPCTRFCPANVYEVVEDDAGKRIQINAANCVHCKTCDIADPYQVINWVTPEGGSGPNYSNL
ncbi:electron transfer flavoprotein-ubiquinone oxidoreductase [Wenzhouxiangella marina]|uniref:Electron transfer flavoprotein-ubiquinone oxidoreductase n=1 Tax=Wenzhouxiangella marina TaxID=1579979 RepID=A0A0K0XXS8_9GAMM|nr:electron transfer flavoprotein-ubiquinone oxidoreductase [Wenzhouxiangella marina]AKS42416.1 electron transfer flavoprotein-ubiquinone oxidoreductase [Wenzhouxiangella marina]MBB6085810.1 electron-transferring-flavoprotein dehydrogenase [Wenzhouxiangella marina]